MTAEIWNGEEENDDEENDNGDNVLLLELEIGSPESRIEIIDVECCGGDGGRSSRFC